MGLKYIRGLSADMDDLLTEQGQKEAGDFLQYVTWCVAEDVYEPFPAPVKAANCVPVEVPAESVQPNCNMRSHKNMHSRRIFMASAE